MSADFSGSAGSELLFQACSSECGDFLMEAPVGFYKSTCEERFVFVNRAMSRMLGYGTPQKFWEAPQQVSGAQRRSMPGSFRS